MGVDPYALAICGNKLYVSNWGGRRPDAASLTGPAGLGTHMRVDDRSIASEGSVSVINLNTHPLPAGEGRGEGEPSKQESVPVLQKTKEILTGRHACALTLSPDGNYLVCANAGDDTLSVIDTRTDVIIETICARENPADLFGAQPNALAFDKHGKTLFVCNGTQNAVAVFKFHPGNSKLLGLVPVGWFPCSIAYNARLDSLDVANIKSIGYGKTAPSGETEFKTGQYYGSLSLVRVPWRHQLGVYTRTALADLRYPLLAPAKLPPRPGQPAQPVTDRVGEPSVFQQVFYIIKENRSYDHIFGDVSVGNGVSILVEFGEVVTPYEHQFVLDFVLLG